MVRTWLISRKPDFYVASATIAMVITTAVYTYYARKQWKEMRNAGRQTDKLLGLYCQQLTQIAKQVSDSHSALVDVQRAFVNFTPFPNVIRSVNNTEATEANGLYFSIPMTNNGNTPTQDMVDHCNAQVLPKTLPKNFPFPDLGDKENVRTVISPKGTIYCAIKVPISKAEIQQAESVPPQGYLYLWGWATYKDVFQRTITHRTEYCYKLTKWGGNSLSLKENAVMQFDLCPIHNCTDNECEEEKIDQDKGNTGATVSPESPEIPCGVTKAN